jgi:5'-nucleotidase
MIVLATTDDGYASESFRALLAAARRWGGEGCRLLGAAPAEDMSGVGASQTAGADVRVAGGDGGDLFALDGTPADCVEWALSENSPLPKPDLVISGVNSVANANSYMIELSGTVGAALTAAAHGLRAVAFSQDSLGFAVSYQLASERAAEALELAVSAYATKKRQKKKTRGICFNVNLPDPSLPCLGIVAARVRGLPEDGSAVPSHGSELAWKQVWSGAGQRSPLDTDALREGCVTVSALQVFAIADPGN